MGLMDKFLDAMRLNGEDDYDDDYEFANEEFYDDDDCDIRLDFNVDGII